MGTEFLEVIDVEEAHRRIETAFALTPSNTESIPLEEALGRITATDIVSPRDVPAFDRSLVDGYALQARSTFGASEQAPTELQLNSEQLAPGVTPTCEVTSGYATPIATGGVVPRGADAVVMREYTQIVDTDSDTPRLLVQRSAVPGALIGFAGSDLTRGERVVSAGVRLTSRETGTLAAIGVGRVEVARPPRVAVISTGDEIVHPIQPLPAGHVHDSNQQILADAVTEQGAIAIRGGIVADDPEQLRVAIDEQLANADIIVLSGGTSKGQGDFGYRVVEGLAEVLFHGVALKPGKPICFAKKVVRGRNRAIVILPGFPTSAVFTFHEFVAPLIRRLLGVAERRSPNTVNARIPMRLNSDLGRTEYTLVSLSREGDEQGYVAYPIGKGSGSVTAFAHADGYIRIPRHQEFIEAGSSHAVTLLAEGVRPADLVIIGSHCVGLDILTRALEQRGFRCKVISVGSQAGLAAAKRGECDVAGIHLCDDKGTYNTPFLTPEIHLEPGYGRMQGIVTREPFRKGSKADGSTADDSEGDCDFVDFDFTTQRMINRNVGSGTRWIIDRFLAQETSGQHPPGYAYEARNHPAVAAAVSQGRADWGVTLDTVAREYGLAFHKLQAERYDFVIPKNRLRRKAVEAFLEVTRDPQIREQIAKRGFRE